MFVGGGDYTGRVQINFAGISFGYLDSKSNDNRKLPPLEERSVSTETSLRRFELLHPGVWTDSEQVYSGEQFRASKAYKELFSEIYPEVAAEIEREKLEAASVEKGGQKALEQDPIVFLEAGSSSKSPLHPLNDTLRPITTDVDENSKGENKISLKRDMNIARIIDGKVQVTTSTRASPAPKTVTPATGDALDTQNQDGIFAPINPDKTDTPKRKKSFLLF